MLLVNSIAIGHFTDEVLGSATTIVIPSKLSVTIQFNAQFMFTLIGRIIGLTVGPFLISEFFSRIHPIEIIYVTVTESNAIYPETSIILTLLRSNTSMNVISE